MLSAFPRSVATLLYSDFTPVGHGKPLLTLRNFISPFFGSRFSSFADYLCPANTDARTGSPGLISRKFASLFGVEQVDIDQMNLECEGGSPYAAPISGAFNRDGVFAEEVLDANKFQSDDNLFDGNEASLRLDYNVNSANRFFTQFNWARAGENYNSLNGLRGFKNPYILTTPTFQISYIHLFTRLVLNEVRAGYARNGSVTTVGSPGVPFIVMDDGISGFGAPPPRKRSAGATEYL